MKRSQLLYSFLAAGVLAAAAYDIVWLNTQSGLSIGVEARQTTNIAFTSDKTEVMVTDGLQIVGTVATTDLQDVTFGQSDGVITVNFGAEGARVLYPGYFDEAEPAFVAEVNQESGGVVIRSATAEALPMEVRVTGSTTNGQVKLYPNGPCNVILDNASIANATGSALNIQASGAEGVVVTLVGESTLADSKKYTTPDGEKEKGAIYSTTSLTFCGQGSVSVTASNKHAICAEQAITFESGTLVVAGAKSDGLHCGEFVMNGGNVQTSNTTGDAIDADKGTATINGGFVTATMAQADTKGITADAGIAFNGGVVNISLAADQGKGVRSKGDITISGNADVTVEVAGSAVVIEGDASYCTGIKPDGDFVMSGGKLTLPGTGTGTRGISAKGIIEFAGGETYVSAAGPSVEYTDVEGVLDSYSSTCVSSDSTIFVNGGKLVLDVQSEQGKGLKADIDVRINGGEVIATCTGNVHILNGDPSYCTAIKAGDDFKMTGGALTIVHSGLGGKGISSNGKTTISGGDISITNSGNGVVYKTTANTYDTATPACITSDKKVTITGGNLALNNSGSAGKCIKGDKAIVIGTAGSEDGPTIVATATGARISESAANAAYAPSYAPGGWNPGGWGPGGGGFDQNGDYANPKGIKADESLEVNSGSITVTCSQQGGEGLESKGTLTVNGGTIVVNSMDDCINAATNITFNGGYVHCVASGNDGIDSNGTITVNGGTIVSIGARSPEEGFDCDNNTFKVTGGTIIGFAGATSTPTSSVCTQRVVSYSASFTTGTTYTVCDPSGKQVVSFKAPSSISGVMLISSPMITNNGTYTIYTGGSLSGGESFFELTTGASYAPGTQTKTFSPTSMVTTVR